MPALRLVLVLAVMTSMLSGAPSRASAAPTATTDASRCHLIAPADATPVGTGTCPGVRPGALVRTSKGSCTFNFVFRGTRRLPSGRILRETYIGTAGHCILGDSATDSEVGERRWRRGEGPVAADSRGRVIGEFAYAILDSPKDFALIRVRPGTYVNPQMCHFGGPTSIDGGTHPREVVPLHFFGQGAAFGKVVPARTLVAYGLHDPAEVTATGTAIVGDSGSGVIGPRGGAVGVLVAVGIGFGGIGTHYADTGNVFITRIGPQLARAERVLGADLRLVTAPLE